MIPFPAGKFRVFYADPAWAYRKKPLENRGKARAVEKEYPTMQPEEIAALPVEAAAEEDAILFLWATGPKLPEALMVMKAWGFKYQTIGFVWIKLTSDGRKPFFGMGFYTRANAELVLVGTRGKGLKRKDASVSQVVADVEYDGPSDEQIASAIREHSAKPYEVRRRIELLYDGPRLEMFARENEWGWTVWGNEAPPDATDKPAWGDENPTEWFDANGPTGEGADGEI
jgi:N6-adenosine-specific RNA methylase IME4